ncbi:MAG TPA: c-type cytochrome [Burkholderiales bacterium]
MRTTGMFRAPNRVALIRVGVLGLAIAGLSACGGNEGSSTDNAAADAAQVNEALIAQGKQTFRFDTFGDEAKWTDVLRMNEVVSTVDPTTALQVGLKVDAEALPPEVVAGIQGGTISLTDPATTLALLKLNAVVGVKGTFDSKGALTRVGFTCALCHSTVDDSFVHGVGKRLDGWPNRDLNVGAIVALSPALAADQATKDVLNSWGPGKYDPRNNFDHQNGPQVIPPAYGLNGIHSITSTGDGSDIAYWNRYVAVTQMGGQGTFSDVRNTVFNTDNIPAGGQDLVTSKLPGLQAYQLTLAAPMPPAGSFDPAAAARGQTLFAGIAKCATCHSGPEFTDANTTLHDPSDGAPEATGVPSYASRSITKKYRTSPLKGVWQHAPYFHNGSAATLDDVVSRYNTRMSLGLTPSQMADLVQYLKSL